MREGRLRIPCGNGYVTLPAWPGLSDPSFLSAENCVRCSSICQSGPPVSVHFGSLPYSPFALCGQLRDCACTFACVVSSGS